MSLSLIEGEIHRFLSTSTPEVLCIKGKWGIGKTFGWNKFLNDCKQSGKLAFDQYSYVSLFGLNSLDDLRFAIFERTVSGSEIGKNANQKIFEKLLDSRKGLWRNLGPIAQIAGAFFKQKDLVDLLSKSASLSISKQLICLDDLERAGGGLKVRDVLGLASFLKLERNCKVVLLLNDEAHVEKEEFNKQLEKVVDVSLAFAPANKEAAEIAILGDDSVSTIIRSRCVELDLTNIRVIKKVEMLSRRIEPIGLLPIFWTPS